MAGMKEIKNRINSVSDTQKITNAMYMIASTKLRKAKQDLEATRPYFDSLAKEIRHIFALEESIESRFFDSVHDTHEKQEGAIGYLVVTADKGLAGAYNHNIIKQTITLMEQNDNNRLFVVGNVGRRFFETHGYSIEKNFLYTAQKPSLRRADEIGKIICDMFRQGELARVYIIYTDMKNSISQEVHCEQLLPLEREPFEDDKGLTKRSHFEYVPGPVQVLEGIVPEYLTGYIYSALVDSFSCEQNARMMAMDSANTNAEQIRSELLLEYNHLRQNAITQEITEVAAGAKAKRKKLEREKLKKKKESAV